MIETMDFWFAMGIWFILCGLVLFTDFYIQDKIEDYRLNNQYIKKIDVIFAIIFFPLTIIGLIIFCLFWVWSKLLDLIHFGNFADWLNTPIIKHREDDD